MAQLFKETSSALRRDFEKIRSELSGKEENVRYLQDQLRTYEENVCFLDENRAALLLLKGNHLPRDFLKRGSRRCCVQAFFVLSLRVRFRPEHPFISPG